MLIAFTAINTRGEIQPFMCQLESLEAGLDVVNLIASQGNRLLDTVLMDGERITPLPVEAFDGQSLSKPINQLENQWKYLLGQPINYTTLLRDLSDRRINLHISNIIKLKQAVDLAEQRLRRVEKGITSEPHRRLIVRRLENVLQRYQSNLAREEIGLQKCIEVVNLLHLTGH